MDTTNLSINASVVGWTHLEHDDVRSHPTSIATEGLRSSPQDGSISAGTLAGSSNTSGPSISALPHINQHYVDDGDYDLHLQVPVSMDLQPWLQPFNDRINTLSSYVNALLERIRLQEYSIDALRKDALDTRMEEIENKYNEILYRLETEQILRKEPA